LANEKIVRPNTYFGKDDKYHACEHNRNGYLYIVVIVRAYMLFFFFHEGKIPTKKCTSNKSPKNIILLNKYFCGRNVAIIPFKLNVYVLRKRVDTVTKNLS